jgi:hypothetical protein
MLVTSAARLFVDAGVTDLADRCELFIDTTGTVAIN